MTKDDDRPQFNPKHRIAGAIILVSLAVIFVPMLFEESKTPALNQSLTQIPARDAAETKVVVTPVPAAAPAKIQTAVAEPLPEKPAASATPVALTKTEVPTAAEPKASPAVEKKAETATKPKTVVAKAAVISDKPGKGWVVQVGTFANATNAERLRDKLKSHGYAVNGESVMLQGASAMRLSVGPYADKSTATKVQAELQKDLSIQGLVLATP